MSPGPYRVGIPGRLILVGSDHASRRGVVSRGWAYPWSESARLESEAVLLVGPSSQKRRSGGRLMTEASAPVGEVGRSRKAGAVPPRPGLMSEI